MHIPPMRTPPMRTPPLRTPPLRPCTGTGTFTWDETNLLNHHSRGTIDVQLADLDHECADHA